MKIVNRTYRDIIGTEPSFQKTTITDLPETAELLTGSLMHVAVKVDDGNNYESMRISTDNFKQRVYESVMNTLRTRYWDTHEYNSQKREPSKKHDVVEGPDSRPAGTSFKDLLDYLENMDERKPASDKNVYAPEEVPEQDPNGFIDHIYYDFDLLKRYMVARDNEIESNITGAIAISNKIDCYFTDKMTLLPTTEDNNMEVVNSSGSVNHGQTENDTYCQMSIEPGNKISNEWQCPETGNLVVYGWLDSSKCLNNKATPSAFCVLEGMINDQWEVISVQPVNPAKSITYVGFNVLVKRGLTIRARTGFDVGAKSGQYSNEQDGFDTLSNTTPNGFKCMVYARKELDQ